MKIFITLELEEGTRLAPHCPELRDLQAKLAKAALKVTVENTTFMEAPEVSVGLEEPSRVCGLCAAPLLPSGQCSSRNCFGRKLKGKLKKLTAP